MSDTGCANHRALAQTRPCWKPFKCLVLRGDAKCDKEGISCYDTRVAERRQKTHRLMSILAFQHFVFPFGKIHNWSLMGGGIFLTRLEIPQHEHVHETAVCSHICLNSFGLSLKFSSRAVPTTGRVCGGLKRTRSGCSCIQSEILKMDLNNHVQPAAKRIYKINIRQWVPMNLCIMTKSEKKTLLWPPKKNNFFHWRVLNGCVVWVTLTISCKWTFQPLLRKFPSKCFRDNVLTQMG